MTTKIILTLPKGSLPPEPHYLEQLLRDALGEFIAAREPTREYVEKRYPYMHLLHQDRKRDEVNNRKLLAETLKKADVSIDILEEQCPNEMLSCY